MINLLLLIGYLAGAFVPYLDTQGIFHMNYTGECVDGIPDVAFVCTEDSLDTDSLLEVYSTLVFMDRETFNLFVESLEEK